MTPDDAPLAIDPGREPLPEPGQPPTPHQGHGSPRRKQPKEPVSLIRMRRTANGLLVLMTALFVVSHLWGGREWWWGYIRAFAEAGGEVVLCHDPSPDPTHSPEGKV